MRLNEANTSRPDLGVLVYVSLFIPWLGGCGDDAVGRISLVRFADDAAVAHVVSPDLEAVETGKILVSDVQYVRELRSRADWSFFHVQDAFGTGTPSTLPESLGSKIVDNPDLKIPAAIGAAAVVDLLGRLPVDIELNGSEEERPPLLLALPLTVEAPHLTRITKPGFLRQLREERSAGQPRLLRGNREGRLRITPPAGARSMLLLATAGDEPAFSLGKVTVSWADPFQVLVEEGQISSHFVADVEVGSIMRPSLVLTPGTTITSRPFVLPPEGELVLHHSMLPMVLNRSVAESLRVTISLLTEGEIEALDEFSASASGDWEERRIPLPRGGEVGQIAFSFDSGSYPSKKPVIVIGAPLVVPGPTENEPLNVVLISLDTLRADRLGCYGNERNLTPALDLLAGEGTVFDYAYSQAPFTLPSHVTLLSGLLPTTHGVETFADKIPGSIPWMAEEFAATGRMTAAFTAGGYLAREFGYAKGFDLYCEVDPIGDRYYPGFARQNTVFPDGSTGSLGRTLDYLKQNKSHPLFLFLHTYMVHCFLPPEDLAREFGLLEEGLPPLTFDEVRRFEGVRVVKHGLSDVDTRLMVDSYDATVRAADDMVGEVVATLKNAGVYDRTVIIVTSDHGEELMDHGGTGHGTTLYDEVIRVPLVIRVPGRAEGERVGKTVGLVDLFPTLLELLNLEEPSPIQGVSFAGVFSGKEIRSRPQVSRVTDPPRSVREAWIENNYKLIRSEQGEGLVFQPLAPFELYRLREDAEEKKNVFGQERETVEFMQRRLEESKKSARARAAELGSAVVGDEPSPELLRRLRELGYVTGDS